MAVEQCDSCLSYGVCNWYCDKNVDIDKVSASMKLDPERWDESYRERNTENVRLLALSVGNGHHSIRALVQDPPFID